jgi:hypothetical protein
MCVLPFRRTDQPEVTFQIHGRHGVDHNHNLAQWRSTTRPYYPRPSFVEVTGTSARFHRTQFTVAFPDFGLPWWACYRPPPDAASRSAQRCVADMPYYSSNSQSILGPRLLDDTLEDPFILAIFLVRLGGQTFIHAIYGSDRLPGARESVKTLGIRPTSLIVLLHIPS